MLTSRLNIGIQTFRRKADEWFYLPASQRQMEVIDFSVISAGSSEAGERQTEWTNSNYSS
jgi:hypothetical protein